MNSNHFIFQDSFDKLTDLDNQSNDTVKQWTGLLEKAKAEQSRMAHTPTFAPALGYISSGFGDRASPFSERTQFHRGIDIAGDLNSPIYATAAGTIVIASLAEDYGKYIIIDHENGLRTTYGHLNSFKIKVGDKVMKGDLIAEMGSTGRSTGPHVHYEVHFNGNLVNPENYIVAHFKLY